jgi:hypothetical protein
MSTAIAGLCVLSVLLSSAALAEEPFARTFKETVLYWDDGDYDYVSNVITGEPGDRVAVMFQAPQWANYVTHVQYFVANDNVMHPVNPMWWTTKPFLVTLWAPSADGDPHPGELAMEQTETDSMYAEDSWFEFELSVPLSISDAVEFPNRTFFAGLQWLHHHNPLVTFDQSNPQELMGWVAETDEWLRFQQGDVMIRAVVSDSLESSSVEASTWGRVKSAYR